SQNSYEAALAIADRVAQEFSEIYERDVVARAELELARLEAETYLPNTFGLAQRYTAATQVLEQRLAELESVEPKRSIDRANVLHIKSLLASGYNRWGYRDRTRQRFNSAVEKYKRAIVLFKELGDDNDSQRAITLNNLAFAIAQQGDLDRALRFVKKALEIHEIQGSRHMFGPTLNNLARIELERDNGPEALRYAQQARLILEDLHSVRFLGLNAHAEGEIWRWLAYSHRENREQSAREYALSFERYTEAIELIDKEGELVRQIEARQGIGCAYRSRGFSRIQRDEDPGDDMRTAEEYLQAALRLCPGDR